MSTSRARRILRYLFRRRLCLRDAGIIAVVMVVAGYVAIAFDLFEASLHAADTATAMLELDEALALGVLLALIMLGVALRQYREQSREIARRREAEREARRLAYQDPLTGLANRRRFEERLAAAIAAPPAAGTSHGLFLLDLNGFKQVNDVYGHGTGDEVLMVVANRLMGAVRDSDLVARLGGDEFAVLAPHLMGPEAATSVALRLTRAFADPIASGRGRHDVGTGIGIALLPQDADDPVEALRRADVALYRAKTERRTAFRFFETQMDDAVRQREALETDLRAAVAKGGLDLLYQPSIELDTGRVTGFEAVISWRHPVHGDIPPERFLPIAEDTGLIHGLGRWMLVEAARTAAGWPADVLLSVDLLPGQVKDPAFAADAQGILAEAGLPASRVEFDIAESTLVGDPDAVRALVGDLRAAGARVALANFGTGYSSLYHLRDLELDRVKIDRSFIQRIDEAETARLVQALAGLGGGLGLDVGAEGLGTGSGTAADRLMASGIRNASTRGQSVTAAESLGMIGATATPPTA
ncbi:MAG: PAS sensor protein [Tistrella sp.]|nr:EAL domain-containing protein [uncultured Tistrella sp.]MAM72629.1 PAS sensor protein [Tistrella sp.]